MGEVRLGTSGFSYEHRKGRFYPEGLPQREWFRFYCEQFDTVELNVADAPIEVLPPGLRGATTRPRIKAPFTADWLYLRRHGPHGAASGYTKRHIEADAAFLRRTGRRSFVYYNNDLDGHAFKEVRTLRRRLALPSSDKRAVSRRTTTIPRQTLKARPS